VLGSGIHTDQMTVERSITLRGVCAERTTLVDGPFGSLASGILRIEDMRIERTLAFVDGDGLVLRGVTFLLEDALEALYLSEGRLDAEDVVVRSADGGLGLTAGSDGVLRVR